jgi:hypothetical protein
MLPHWLHDWSVPVYIAVLSRFSICLSIAVSPSPFHWNCSPLYDWLDPSLSISPTAAIKVYLTCVSWSQCRLWSFDTIYHSILLHRLRHSWTFWHSSPMASFLSYWPNSGCPSWFSYISPLQSASSAVCLRARYYRPPIASFHHLYMHLPCIAHVVFVWRQTLGCSLLSLLITTYLWTFNLESYLHAVSLSTWFSLNGLVLNPSKSASALFGTRQRSHSYVDVQLVCVSCRVCHSARWRHQNPRAGWHWTRIFPWTSK